MAKQTVALYTVTSGDRVERARSSLAEALGDAKLGDPDSAGVFELTVDAESPDAARDLVREAFARAGTGGDFVISEGTEGREISDADPRQGPAPDRSARVADAASAVAAAAASSGAADAVKGAASSAADTVREAASSAASSDAAGAAREAVTDAAQSVREAVDEKGVGGAASDYASTAAEAAQSRDLQRYLPVAGLGLLLLLLLRRGRR